MSGLTWGRAELWPLLLALPVFAYALWRLLRWSTVGGVRYGAELHERPQVPARRAALWSAAAGFLLLTWMDPQLGEETVAVERRGLDVVFALDVSRSMLARDLEPYRLERAKRDIKSVLPLLAGGDRAGLVAFAGKARVIVPLTHDIDSFRALLDQVDTASAGIGGTDLGAAVRAALGLIDRNESNTSVVVLLTDGEDLGGAGRQAAGEAAADHVIVHCVGYGSTRGSKIVLEEAGKEEFLKSRQGEEVVSSLDPEGLRAIAQATGGEFVRADVMPLPLVELKQKRMDPMLKRSYEAGQEVLHKSRFQWALLPAVLLMIFAILCHGGQR